MRKKLFLVSLLFCLVLNGAGQNLTFSLEIKTSTDSTIRELSEIWEEYFAARRGKDKNAIYEYWSPEEGFDLLSGSFGSMLYNIGRHFCFSIRPVDEHGIYEINTLMDIGRSDTARNVLCIYRIGAKKIDGRFRLFNLFSYEQTRLNVHTVGEITYYYPNSYLFSREEADRASQFLRDLKDMYGFTDTTTVNYILSNTLDEANRYIGFLYTVGRSHLTYAGLSIFPNYILSCRADHLHELVHAVIRPQYPRASSLLHEGIATYYGGSSGLFYKDQVKLLKEYLRTHPEINLADFDSYDLLINDRNNPYYTVGAMIIEKALSIGGAVKVKELFTYGSIQEMFDKGLQVSEDQIHDYLHNLIFTHDAQ